MLIWFTDLSERIKWSKFYRNESCHIFLRLCCILVETDANSVVKIKVTDQVPKLHYIYPTFFEAGKPMEFVACGSHLLQPNFRYDMMCWLERNTFKIFIMCVYTLFVLYYQALCSYYHSLKSVVNLFFVVLWFPKPTILISLTLWWEEDGM